MGKIAKIIHEELLPETAERNGNLLRVYEAPNGEITIHIRQLKIVLQKPEEIEEWKNGFAEALNKLHEVSGN